MFSDIYRRQLQGSTFAVGAVLSAEVYIQSGRPHIGGMEAMMIRPSEQP
jgi:hypothetical protein